MINFTSAVGGKGQMLLVKFTAFWGPNLYIVCLGSTSNVCSEDMDSGQYATKEFLEEKLESVLEGRYSGKVGCYWGRTNVCAGGGNALRRANVCAGDRFPRWQSAIKTCRVYNRLGENKSKNLKPQVYKKKVFTIIKKKMSVFPFLQCIRKDITCGPM